MTILFNPTDPQFIANPYPTLKRLREEDPYHQSPLGFWFFTRFEDVEKILHDDRFTHNHAHRMVEKHGEEALQHSSIRYLSNTILLQNPPYHTTLRRLMAPFFAPKYLEKSRDDLHAYIENALKGVEHDHQMDFIADFAQPVLGHMICDILGIPKEARSPFIGHTCLSARSLDPAAVDPTTRAMLDAQVDALYPLFKSLFRERRAAPKQDLITAMVQAMEENNQLTEEALIDNCLFLFAAGQEVTKCLMANILVDLDRFPQAWERLVREPERIHSCYDELLRYSTALQMTHRLAAQDLIYKGCTIKKGQPVIVSLAPANRDPNVIADPDQLDLDRPKERVKHLAFGKGFHYCIGAHLGLFEMKHMFNALFQRFPNLSLAPQTVEWQQTITIRGLTKLKLTW